MAHVMRLEVRGTGSYLPDEIIPNSHFTGKELNKYDRDEIVVGTTILTEERIFETTGIRERRRSSISPAEMGYLAAVNALEMAKMDPKSLTGIVLASVTEPNFPDGAGKIQNELGAINVRETFDINNACAGFTKAVKIVNSLCYDSPGNYLVIGSERLTSITDDSDINSTLFGDGAGAVVLSPTSGKRGIVASYSRNDPSNGNLDLIFRGKSGFLRMPDGRPVMKRAVTAMVDCAVQLKLDAGWDDADVYIPHQANGRILEAVEKKLPRGSLVFKNVEKYGNMSAATCAVGLDEAIRQGMISEGKRVILTSFGSGLVTSGAAIQF